MARTVLENGKELKVVTLVAVTIGYANMLMSFVCQMRMLGLADNLVVAALDEDLYRFAFLQGLAVYYEQVRGRSVLICVYIYVYTYTYTYKTCLGVRSAIQGSLTFGPDWPQGMAAYYEQVGENVSDDRHGHLEYHFPGSTSISQPSV